MLFKHKQAYKTSSSIYQFTLFTKINKTNLIILLYLFNKKNVLNFRIASKILKLKKPKNYMLE